MGAVSAMWLPLCGQSWLGAAAGFIGMWAAMMVPMMLPLAVVPLRRYGAERTFPLTVAAALAWAATWTAAGLPVYLVGAAVASALLDTPALARTMPVIAAVAGVAGVAWQVATWRRRPAHPSVCASPGYAAALRYGAHLGAHCVRRCTGLTVALLAAGIMERSTMVCAFALVAAESVRLRER